MPGDVIWEPSEASIAASNLALLFFYLAPLIIIVLAAFAVVVAASVLEIFTAP
ncbi:MAG: hypothetical protein Q7S25_00440 [Candidatus Limnocylindria bacterium]|nr:hypothetical protein [Candidatus Limnocylindria bacterium]